MARMKDMYVVVTVNISTGRTAPVVLRMFAGFLNFLTWLEHRHIYLRRKTLVNYNVALADIFLNMALRLPEKDNRKKMIKKRKKRK